MTLTSAYSAFLASPKAASLTDDAVITYIPSLVAVSGSDNIEKHFAREPKLLKRKSEKVLHSIENDNSLCVELDTIIEFDAGGGSYLPGLDDNFLSDQTVNLPMIHIVQFSADSKIQQVRIFWDQASLLKLVDVIGSRAKNWPVKNGIDAIRAIKTSVAAVPSSAGTPTKQDLPVRPKSVSNAMRDPMASLELFKPRNVDEEEEEKLEQPRAPRGDARPPPREYTELFAAAQDDPRERSESPSKSRSRAKSGAGKNYKEPRVFSPERLQPVDESPQKPVVGKKYDHFEFSDNADLPLPEQAKSRTRSRHQSQWDFEDFVATARPTSKHRQEQRTVSWSDDEPESPQPREKTGPNPRRDAETHFDFKDQATPAANRQQPPRGTGRTQGSMNTDSKLYKNNLYDENGVPGTPRNETGIANVKDRHKDFDAHWQVAEGTPRAASREAATDRRSQLQPVVSTSTDHGARHKDFDSQFEVQDDSPQLGEQSASDRNRLAGHGKGGVRRGAGQPSWSLTGDDEEPQSAKKIYRTAGDGMGGRSGTRRWGVNGDE